MKERTLLSGCLALTGMLCLTANIAFADGNAEKGKAYFNDPKFANGTSGKTCNSCHKNGRGLAGAESKTAWKIMGKKQPSIEATINYAIDKALHGKTIGNDSEEMKDLIAYIKTLK